MTDYPRNHVSKVGLKDMDDAFIASWTMFDVIIQQAKQYQK